MVSLKVMGKTGEYTKSLDQVIYNVVNMELNLLMTLDGI